MKNITLKRIYAGIFSLLTVTLLLTACSKKSDNVVSSKTSHKVVFKATASTGSSITDAVYGYDGTQTTATSLSGTTWTSPEITVPAGTVEAVCVVGGTGVNASSTLTVQVYVDGNMVKQGSGSGQGLNASVSYSF